jgi:DNA-binding transcriptional regulator YdaS (Cro superfamily)
MKLSDYIASLPRSKNICEMAGVSKQTLSHLRNGRQVRASTLISIARATKGKVSVEEIYDEYFVKKEKT